MAAAGAARGAALRGAAGAGGFGGPAVLPASGGRSARGGAGGVVERAAPAGGVGGFDDLHAGGADGRSGAADAAVEGPRELPGAADRAAVRQGSDPGDVPQPPPLWRQRRGDRGGGVVLLRQGAGPALPGGDRAADGPPPLAAPLRSDAPSQGGPGRPATGCSGSSRRAGCSRAGSSTRRGGSRFPRPAGGLRSWLPTSRRWWRRSFRASRGSAPRSTARRSRSPRRRWRGGSASCGTRGSATPPWW